MKRALLLIVLLGALQGNVLAAKSFTVEGANGAPVIDLTTTVVNEVPAGFALDLMRHFRMRHIDPRRSYIHTHGIEDWKTLFEHAGFRNALIACEVPIAVEDPNWDPGDVRYNVVRWTPSGRQSAMGHAVIDPRSGEVISSHAIFRRDVLRLAETWYFTQVASLGPRASTLPLPKEVIGDMVRHSVSHETGHAFGLRHNFKGHSASSVAQLRDKEWKRTWGNSASLMDYSRLNYGAQPSDDAYLLPRFGPYDYLAIEWGYRQTSAQLHFAIARRQWDHGRPGV